MVANVASELHDLYAEWRGRFANQARQPLATLRPREVDGAAAFRRAYRLLTRISDLLMRFEAEGRSVAVFQRQLDGWARVPLMINAGWSQNVQAEQAVPQVVLEQLQAFDAYLEGKVLTYDDSRIPSLRKLVEQANSALADDDELPAELVGYIRRLLTEIQFALDDEHIGLGFDFADAVQRLWVTFNAAAERSQSEERKARWRGIVDQITAGVVGGGFVEAAKVVIAITAGP